MKILIAEDVRHTAMQYMIVLSKRGHQVVTTQDGVDCLKAYNDAWKQSNPKTPNDSQFDVVVLDYRMPGKDGMQVAKQILAINPKQRIIFASAYVRETLLELAKELKSSVELIEKPFELEDFIAKIEEPYERLNAGTANKRSSK